MKNELSMRRAFSLVEVVIAVGIFAGSIVVILSLLPSLVRQSTDSNERLIAQRMLDGVQTELEREATSIGFDSLAASVPVMGVPLDNGHALVATIAGLRIEPESGAGSGGILLDEQHFLVELWRFSSPPLSYDPTAAVLPVYVRISWPYRVPGPGTATRLADRHQFTTTLALDR